MTKFEMNRQQTIIKTADHVRQTLQGEGSGHDWWHVYRVWQMAKHIAKKETRAITFVVELAALLHDIADWKFNGGDESVGPKKATEWLTKMKVETAVIEHVANIILTMSYKGAKVSTPMTTLEGQIVQDADRLDAIGAIGIARTFAFGGHRNRPMYDPDTKPTMHENAEAYKSSSETGHTINHFYEKLLLLKDRMNTNTAKELAVARTKYMDEFLRKFYAEWEGKE